MASAATNLGGKSKDTAEELFECFRRPETPQKKEKARELIDFFEKDEIKDMKDALGRSLLQWACIRGWLDVCILLVSEYGCDPYYEDHNKWTPLHNSCRNGHLHVVQYFFETLNMNATSITKENRAHKMGDKPMTPLSFSEKFDRIKITEYLRDRIVDCAIKPSVGDLRRALKNLNNWKQFAGYLPDISQKNIQEIEQKQPTDLEMQKRELFIKWLLKSGKTKNKSNGSWKEVVKALKSSDQNAVVQDVIEYIIENNLISPLPAGLADDNLNDFEFEKAMSEGSGEIAQLNVILQGAPASGKTSVERVIMGQSPLPEEEQNSTDIMENAIRAVSMRRLKGLLNEESENKGFQEISDEEFLNLLVEATKDQMKKQDNWPETSGSQSHDINISSTTVKPKQTALPSSAAISSQDVPTQAPTPINASAFKKNEVLKKIRENLKKVQASSTLFKSKWHHLIDCGGQPQFQDIFPLLYHGPALQLVVMRLTKGLDDRPPWCYTIKGQNASQSKHRVQLTNRQYIERMCQIAATSNPPSHVMIVGTHKDKLGDNSEALIAELNKGLEDTRKKYANGKCNVLICKNADKNEIIFDMNAMAPGREREEYTKELQEIIDDVNDQVNTKLQVVPLKWFAFQLSISNESGIVYREEYLEKGGVLGMDDTAIQHALKYLNRAALLLYYDEVPELALTKVDPLINKLSAVVKASFPLERKTKCVPDRHLLRLQSKGIFDEAFLIKLVKEMPNSCSSLTNDMFLKLLCCLKVVVKIRDRSPEYFLPGVLSFTRSPESLQRLCEVFKPVSTFGFRLDGCPVEEAFHILPHGFFFTAVIELLSHQQSGAKDHEDDQPKFALFIKESVDHCYDEILFDEKNNVIPNGLVMVVNKVNWIEVSTMCNDSRYYPAIFKSIKAAVERAMKHFPSMKELSLKDVYPCPACPSHTDHYCDLTSDKRYANCSKNRGQSVPTPDKIRCWIDSFTPESSSRPIDVHTAFKFLQDKSANWDGIARAFDIDLNFREGLKKDVSLDNDRRLETVLGKWKESTIQPATWCRFMEILSSELQYNDVVQKVQTYLDQSLNSAYHERRKRSVSHGSIDMPKEKTRKLSSNAAEDLAESSRMEGTSTRQVQRKRKYDSSDSDCDEESDKVLEKNARHENSNK